MNFACKCRQGGFKPWTPTKASIGLLPRQALDSYQGKPWTPTKASLGLLPRQALDSCQGKPWTPTKASLGLLPRQALDSYWQGLFGPLHKQITMMQIHIRLYGPLRDRLPAKTKGRLTLELAEGAIVQDIFDRLNLPRTLLVAVNNQHESSTETPLHDGDRVAFFTPVSGG